MVSWVGEDSKSNAVASAISYSHLGIFLGVHHSSKGNAEVGDGAPEVCGVEMSAFQ